MLQFASLLEAGEGFESVAKGNYLPSLPATTVSTLQRVYLLEEFEVHDPHWQTELAPAISTKTRKSEYGTGGPGIASSSRS